MNNSWRRFAPVGLYVALLALLTAGGLYVVFKTFTLAIQISLGVAVLGVASFIIIDTDRALKAITGRQARYGSNALILSKQPRRTWANLRNYWLSLKAKSR